MRMHKLLFLIGLLLVSILVYLVPSSKSERSIAVTTDMDASPEDVWQVLLETESYDSWKAPLRFVIPPSRVGEKMAFHFIEEDGEPGMTFRPTVLVLEENRELRWLGHFILPGVFDGEHAFVLEPLPDGKTRLHHTEHFRGMLVPFTGQLIQSMEDRFGLFNERLKNHVEAS